MSSLWVRSLCLVGLSVGWAWGSTTCVQFDVAETVSCRPLELHGQPVAVSAGEMLVEATFEVSSLIHFATERRAAATAVRLKSAQRTAQVVDYAPKIQMESPLVGDVDVQSQTAKSSSWAFDAGTHGTPLFSATASGAASTKSASMAHYELLPPLQLLASSGTVACKDSAVYFKLKPLPADLAGRSSAARRRFSCPAGLAHRLRPPASQGVRTLGSGHPAGRREADCGSADFLLGIYQPR